MSDTHTDVQKEPTALKDQYAAQLGADLERNASEQERIRTEVHSLQQQLQVLERDQELLLRMRHLLDGKPADSASDAPQEKEAAPQEEAAAPQDEAPQDKAADQVTQVPAPRAPSARAKRAARKKTPAVKAKTPAKAPAQPTLVDLARAHLSEQSEPCSAAQVTAVLAQKHPDRTVKTTVVRTTLENLVARGQARRSKQDNSVFYTASEAPTTPEAPEQPAQAQGAEPPAQDTEPAPESEG
ncbi:hypothetical protein [Streptomyces sp. NPDC059063]|uniref:hypothetical protein n=1 Tax=unclassified Streptomyces TaxID=2593676 RepID=UPI0036A7DBF4